MACGGEVVVSSVTAHGPRDVVALAAAAPVAVAASPEPDDSIGGRARDGGPAIAKALRERGLIGTHRSRNEITPEGRAFCERIIPVLAVCSFIMDCGNSWKVEQLRQRRAGAEVAA